ncbi:MAG: metal ABC transporter ATP-binding protein [Bacteroidales bacterium]|jgi:zinc transport system ATP-binding protein|nr:metal ABC transporter ATP-binding protein [Bacteroidales bacterium]
MLVKLNNIWAKYDKEIVLEDVNLTINNGDFIGVIGPNGGGKTTLIKIILGVKKAYKGNIEYTGNINIGYLPQQNNIDKMFPVNIEDVVYSGLISGDNSGSKMSFNALKKQAKPKFDDLLVKMNLYDIRKKSLGTLSGGQIQKTLLCRALISNPDLLLLDEPNTYIDKESEFELYNYLKNESGIKALLLVSHDLGTISSYIKSIACVNRTLFYHDSNLITEDVLNSYNCPIQLITHGEVPHSVLKEH